MHVVLFLEVKLKRKCKIYALLRVNGETPNISWAVNQWIE